jgi:diguanylate cyclase (GGDEF)-like protein
MTCDHPIIVTSLSRVIFVNSAAIGLLGTVNELNIVGKLVTELVEAYSGEALEPEVIGCAPRYRDATLRRFDDATVPVSVALLPCSYGGQNSMQILIRDLSERRKLETRVLYLVQHDALTELPNRTEFRDRLVGAIARAQRNARQVAVMLINLDHFKLINSLQGMEAGDLVLREVAQRLKASVRAADSVARIAGDEFGLILEAIDQREQGAVVANRVLTALKEPISIGSGQVTITASAGIAAWPSDARDIGDLLRMADVALYAAKAGGTGGFRFYFADMEAATQRDRLRREQITLRLATLTNRERDVLDVLIDGNSNKAIAYLLGASPRTIENHRAKIMLKMHADSLPDLVRMVLESTSNKDSVG